MKTELTKEQILDEMTRLRSACEQVKRQTQQLMCRTSRLYVEIENLAPDSGRKITVNGRKL